MTKRIITGAIGGIGFLSLLYLGGTAYGVLLFFIVFLGFYEWLRMNSIHIWDISSIIGFIFTIYYFLPTRFYGGPTIEAVLLEVLLLLLVPVMTKNKSSIHEVAYILLGSLYLGTSFHLMMETRLLTEGFAITLTILIAVWTTDSAAYFVGKAIGKHKLWPAISPNKTIEGSLGGIVFAIVFVAVVNLFVGGATFFHAILIALTVAISGQLGDLVESAVKRALDVKDSGRILPGHGGILDRFDSLIFVFPVLYLFTLI
ncbi:hypothetical protein BEP19_07620 [Ammoniphilus oxalaticus]|uniref:Phosphatidate cytidylyltransferase n=1 Tax=Ammoniphilus oxalaticus TaxID=66863 RepID=A0A419SJW3_9BACL|nr:phosphatidate cytidylyltransferase [Ammoniphilus oxalaticus]RKD24262.1 hypothetical protein BEP19_07620 [Ammoniphilus oxalaticus]